MDFEKPAVVMDMGGHTFKAGFACDNFPVMMFRNLVARPKNIWPPYGRGEHYEVYIGDDAVLRGEEMDLNWPIVDGRIVHWDNIERVWHHVFYSALKVAPEDRNIMLSSSAVMPMSEKIECCSVFFEVLNSPALCIQPGNVLSLYGSGFTTGCTVDLGYDTVDVSPVFEGSLIKYAHMTSGYAGRQMCDYIRNCLAERNIDFGYKTPEIIDDIIKDSVYVTDDAAMSRTGYKRYANSIDISNEAFMAGEMMFQPDMVLGRKAPFKSLTDTVLQSIGKCDNDLRKEMYPAIVVSGGLSQIPRLPERLQAKMTETLSRNITVNTSPESHVLGWMGGALFAGITEADRIWITRKQYDDYGVKIIRNRFM